MGLVLPLSSLLINKSSGDSASLVDVLKSTVLLPPLGGNPVFSIAGGVPVNALRIDSFEVFGRVPVPESLRILTGFCWLLVAVVAVSNICLLYTSPSPRD